MSFEQEHIPDEILFDYADDAQGVLDRTGVEAHLAACAACAARLADLAVFTAALREESTWWAAGEIATGKAQSAIEAYSERLAREDAEAARMLGDMLESQYLFVRANIARKRRLHTGGVVRVLTKTAREECDGTPLFAVALAETAGIIAEVLPDDYYPAGAVNILRGDAWIEYATACRHLGRFEDGFDGVTRAERNYKRLLDPGMFLARVALARATLFWEQQKYDEALRFARDAAERFADRRATEEYAAAKEWEALILHRKGDVVAASETYSKVFVIADSISDLEMRARAARNLAIVCRGRGDIASAGDYLLIALKIYEDLGKRAMVVQTHWMIAALSLFGGNAVAAAERLPELITELIELGMSTDAARAQLDLAEALVVLNRLDEAREICAALVSFFRRADMLTGAVTVAVFLRQVRRQHYEQQFDNYLHYCYAQRTPARVSELSDLLHASSPYLSRAIVDLFGKTPHRMLHERKLDEACRLLRHTSLSVEEIASASAFGTDATLFRAFRHAFGMTPAEYRRQVTETG